LFVLKRRRRERLVNCNSPLLFKLLLIHLRRFSGDESFVAKSGEGSAQDAGSALGVIIEGNKNALNPSRL
jgi:hypothetical protein